MFYPVVVAGHVAFQPVIHYIIMENEPDVYMNYVTKMTLNFTTEFKETGQ